MSFLHLHPRQKLIILAITFVISWIIGTFVLHYFERGQNWSYFDALYFNVITTATIGFGDLTPHSREGKIVTMIYAVFYVPLFLYSMTLIFDINIRKMYIKERHIQSMINNRKHDIQAIISDSK